MKRFLVVLFVSLCVLCGNCFAYGYDTTETFSGFFGYDDIELSDDGRVIGGYFEGRPGDVFTNNFFDFEIKSAQLVDKYEGQTPAAGNIFLVADIFVKNTFGWNAIPMWSSDFQIQWGESENDYGFPIDKFTDAQMDDEYTLKRGESVRALCVYEVPRPAQTHEYSISYLEIYEDGLEGNVFFCYFDLNPDGTLDVASSGNAVIGITGIQLLEDGREIGGYFNGRMSDTYSTAFFDYEVKNAQLANEYDGLSPADGMVFLVSELSVKNTYDEAIPMFSSDFQVQWGFGDEDYGFPINQFTGAQMDDEYILDVGESVTALCVYEVPQKGTYEYSISYLEIYDDEVEGSVFFCYFELNPTGIVAYNSGSELIDNTGIVETKGIDGTGGYVEGNINDTFETAFFDYNVNIAYLTTGYEGQSPAEGNVYVVSELTVKNTFEEAIPMFSSDFQIQWGEGDNDYGFPIEQFTDAQMDDEYVLNVGEAVTALCVFEVPMPNGPQEYSISYLEVFEDGEEGRVFFCYFDPIPMCDQEGYEALPVDLDAENNAQASGYFEGQIGDTFETAFFDYEVKNAYLSSEYLGQSPTEGTMFLVSELTVENTYGQDLPMFSNDFQVHWGSGDNDYGSPIEQFTDAQMDDAYTIKQGETVTALCVFEVPKPTGAQNYVISYLEIFDDESIGNLFFCLFELNPPIHYTKL